MTVKDLIKKLEKQDQYLEIYVSNDFYGKVNKANQITIADLKNKNNKIEKKGILIEYNFLKGAGD